MLSNDSSVDLDEVDAVEVKVDCDSSTGNADLELAIAVLLNGI